MLLLVILVSAVGYFTSPVLVTGDNPPDLMARLVIALVYAVFAGLALGIREWQRGGEKP